jgi:hypothetical protein
MKTFKDDIDYIPEIIEKRGFIISKAIAIEEIIDSIITNFFVDTSARKKKEFHRQMLSTMNINSKIEIIKTIFFQTNLEPKEKEQNVKLFRLIEDIFKTRNAMAHWQWSMITENQDVLLLNKRKRWLEVFNDAKIELYLKNWKKARDILSILYFKYFNNKS